MQASGPGALEHLLGALEALDGGGTRCGARACRGSAPRALCGTCSLWGCTAQHHCPCTHWDAAHPNDGPWWTLHGSLLPPCAGATQKVPSSSCQNGELPHPAYKKSWALLPRDGPGAAAEARRPMAGLHDDGALRAECKVKSTWSRWLDGALQLVGSQALERWPAQCTGSVGGTDVGMGACGVDWPAPWTPVDKAGHGAAPHVPWVTPHSWHAEAGVPCRAEGAGGFLGRGVSHPIANGSAAVTPMGCGETGGGIPESFASQCPQTQQPPSPGGLSPS